MPELAEKQYNSPHEQLSGLVERITFHNPDNGFCVLKVMVKGHRDLVTVVGHVTSIAVGEIVQAVGFWIHDKNFGQQFKVSKLQVTPPTTKEGMEKYLGSGMIKGIGPVYAKRLIRAFDKDVFDIIENQPERLCEVDGIGTIRAAKITAGWQEQKSVREIMVFLHQHGVSTSRAVRIHKVYGENAIQIISENPYQLARDIRGIGFISADAIAGNLGIEKTSMIRARAGISYALLQAMDDGHCGLPKNELIASTQALLDISQDLIEQALKMEIETREVIASSIEQHECIFLASFYHIEKNVAHKLHRLSSLPSPWPQIDVDKAIAWVEEKLHIALADSQQQALRTALNSKILVITGGPGVGKTTLINSLLKILKAKGIVINLCASTGRAAKRLSESTGFEAKTIHRLLEPNFKSGGFNKGENDFLKCDLLVVDEVSMVDIVLMNALLKAIPDHAAVVMVGDIDQLPSVGPGQVLLDIIESETIPVVRLTEVFRQAANSLIIANAHRINNGQMPDSQAPSEKSDFFFLECNEPEDGQKLLLKIVQERIPAKFKLDPISDIQILCPMNRGAMGARSLNIELKRILNPTTEAGVGRFGMVFHTGDKVMQTENNYEKEVYNGDLGIISFIDHETNEVMIVFDGRQITYDFNEMDQVLLAYATTIHKAQGSEYPAVIIPLFMQHYLMLKKNLIYTGITRGKQLVVVIGQKKALAIAVKNKQNQRRWSKLKEWLIEFQK